MALLALVRHGESEWNARDLWTGWTDVDLTERGHRQAKAIGAKIKDISWDMAFESSLKRAKDTLTDIKEVLGQVDLPTESSKSLDERDYGNFAGMNKIEVEVRYGEDLFQKWHRGWDYPLPHGETLKDVYQRVVPYFENQILPLLKGGKNVLVSAHGNSLRALIKYLENISDEDVTRLEVGFGEIYLYNFDKNGKMLSREVRRI